MRASHAYHSLSSSSLNVDESLSSPSSGGIGSLFLAWGPLGGFGFNGHTGFFQQILLQSTFCCQSSTFHLSLLHLLCVQLLDGLPFQLYLGPVYFLPLPIALPLHLLFLGLHASITISTNGGNAFRMGQVSAFASRKNLRVFSFFPILLGIKSVVHLSQGHILDHKQCCIGLFSLFMIANHLLCQG